MNDLKPHTAIVGKQQSMAVEEATIKIKYKWRSKS